MKLKQYTLVDNKGKEITGIIAFQTYQEGIIILTNSGSLYSNVKIKDYDEDNKSSIEEKISINRGKINNYTANSEEDL